MRSLVQAIYFVPFAEPGCGPGGPGGKAGVCRFLQIPKAAIPNPVW
jgi:hypothetical protein